jgi:hypothetical protein
LDKAVLDKAVLDKAVLDKAVLDKAVLDKAVLDSDRRPTASNMGNPAVSSPSAHSDIIPAGAGNRWDGASSGAANSVSFRNRT